MQIADSLLKKHSLRMLGGYVELGDPRYYVHFIDWDDLKLVSEAELHHAQISTDVPFAHQDQLTEWFVWKPPHKGFIWNHHLHTEDEVFEYNMAHWPWPDHYLDDLVVFHAREIFGTEILGDLPNFWGDWVSFLLISSRYDKQKSRLTVSIERLCYYATVGG